MQPQFRLATEADLEQTFQVYLDANQDLTAALAGLPILRSIPCRPGRLPFAGMPSATIRSGFGLLNSEQLLAGLD